MPRRRIMIDTECELPPGYIRCKYLENGGSHQQYINTGIPLINRDLSFRMKVHVLDLKQIDSWFFGESLYVTQRFTGIGYSAKDNAGLYGCYDSRNFAYSRDTTGIYDFTFTKDTLICNGISVSVTPLTNNYRGNTIWLFGLNDYAHPSYCRVFHFSIIRNDETILNFIPALDPSGRPCMYDTITQKPFYNSGNGEFLYKI